MGATAYAAAVLADSPGLYWKQQEASGLPQDSSGNARHATSVAGTPGYQQSGQPQMGDFSMRYVAATNNAVRNPHGLGTASGDLAIEAWLLFESIANGTQVIRWGLPGTNGVTLNIRSTGKFYVVLENAATLSDSAASLSASTWYHIVFTRVSTVWKYYLNGALDTASAGTSTPNAPNNNNISIGSPVTLRCEHFAVYPTASLSATQVSTHYSAAGDKAGYASAGSIGAGAAASAFVELGRGVAGIVGAGPSESGFAEAGRGVVGSVGSGISQKIAAGGGTTTNKVGFGQVNLFGAGAKIVTHVGTTSTKAGRGIVGLAGVSADSGKTTQPRGVSLALGQSVLTAYPEWTRVDGGA